MARDALARRFLHVNLNCDSLDATERLYGGTLGLKARMRTDPKVSTDGSILGIEGETYCGTSFLYDARGGRGGCALETIEYFTPPLSRDSSADPVRPGIRSVQLGVGDTTGVAAALRKAGLAVGRTPKGLIGDAESVLVRDRDGVVVELTALPSGADPSKGALFNGIAMVAIDISATGEFLTSIGFEEVQAPEPVSLAGAQLAPGGSGRTDGLVARYTLAEDGHQFALVVVQHPDTVPVPVPWGGNRQGLYRCALRVENLRDALAAVPDSIQRMGEPVWCPLPGTKIDGLHIAFLRSPDGVVFEFVERPLSFF